MVERITVQLSNLRGGGFLIEDSAISDFLSEDCDLYTRSDVIDEIPVSVFHISTGSGENGYSVAEIMHLISSNLIKNLVFTNNQIRYDSYSPNEITNMEDLNGVIVGLRYSEGAILFDTFESNNALLYAEDLTVLAGAVTNLRYTNNSIRYDIVGEINE